MRKNILLNFLAGGSGKVSLLIYRFVQVPILLAVLGVDEFGRWLVISSLPSWLSLANLGFGTVAANEMCMAASSNELGRARQVYSTTLAVVTLIAIAGSLAVVVMAGQVPWTKLLGVSHFRQSELEWAVVWLAVGLFLSFCSEVTGGRLRVAKKAHIGLATAAARPWVELFAILIVVRWTSRLDHLAMAICAAGVIYSGAMIWLSRRATPNIVFSKSDFQYERVWDLFRKGLAFQAVPLGNAILFQGSLLVVQAVLGPAAVALYGTTRMLIRSVTQAMELVSQVMWVELSHLIGAKDFCKAARLHRAGVGVCLLAALAGTLFVALTGETLYVWWTSSNLSLPLEVLLLFLLTVPLGALWLTSAVVHYACNQHEGLAVRYLVAAALSVIGCAVLGAQFGVAGAALAAAIVDVLLIPYVLRRSLVLTQDSWREFLPGMFREIASAIKTLRRRRKPVRPAGA